MSTVTVAVKITRTCEVRIPLPAPVAELGKAYDAAKREADQRGVNTTFDDWCTVTAEDDDVLVLSFPLDQP